MERSKLNHFKSAGLLLFLLFLYLPATCHSKESVFFYDKQAFGSEAFYNPLNQSVSYFLDTVQLSQNFDTDDFNQRWRTVTEHLLHPDEAIREEGGLKRFLNRQIFPVDNDYSNESFALIPNYFLHLFGGGMVYRKDLEYFREKGYSHPALLSLTLAMTSELIQEVIEKKSTTADDEVADILLFRPLGILLFSNDTVAGFVDRHLSPAIWPHLSVYDIRNKKAHNTGINYVIRPPALDFGNLRFFSFIGLNNLLGFSHKTGNQSYISWGAGYATKKIDLDLDIAAELRPSCGLFYDKNDSLLWSVILNGTEEMKLRVNIYPLQKTPFNKIGFFSGLSDDNIFSAGLIFNFPIGIGSSF